MSEHRGQNQVARTPTDPATDRTATRAMVHHYPEYEKLRCVLPVWEGSPDGAITRMQSTLRACTGTPQEQLGWTDPDTWIDERLKGEAREWAHRIWAGTGKSVSPRYVSGHWQLVRIYGLLEADVDGIQRLTAAGRGFLDSSEGETVRRIDRDQGLLRILKLVAGEGAATRADLLQPWLQFLRSETRIRSESTAKNLLYRRLGNLLERGYLIRIGLSYKATESGLHYLGPQADDEPRPGLKTQRLHLPKIPRTIALFLLVVGAFLIARWLETEREVYVALFGIQRDRPHSEFAALNRHALEHYLEQLSDDVPGYRFVLRPFYIDDFPQHDPETLRWMYETIVAADERYVVVIDNTWTRDLRAVESVARDSAIPIISLNADKGSTSFSGHGIFLGHRDLAPTDLVTYMNQVIRPATVGFVGERDLPMTQEFLRLAGNSPELPVRSSLRLDHTMQVTEDRIIDAERKALHESLEGWYNDAPQPAVLLLSVHNVWGQEIVDYVDLHLEDVTILASDWAVRRVAAFPRRDSGNRLIQLTEREDAIAKRVLQDAEFFFERYPEVRGINIPKFVKRCLDAAEIMREALKSAASRSEGKLLDIDRELFAGYFRNELIGNSISGRYDLYTFDAEGLRVPETSFVEYYRGVATPQWYQLNSRREVVPTLLFGIELLDIGRLDPVSGSFHADFYYWVRLEPGAQNQAAVRDISEYIHFRNLSKLNSKILIESALDGTYRAERISGDFNADFELKDYPLDTQRLALELEVANPFDDVRVVFDYAGFERGRRRTAAFDIPGWKLVDYYVDYVISQIPGGTQAPRSYKTLTMNIVTNRGIQSVAISVALPLCTIGIAALSLLFIRDIRFRWVGDIYIGVFLSIITYSIAFAQITPATDVVTRADYLFYLTFLIVLLVFLRFIALNVLGRVREDGKIESHQPRTLGYGAVAVYVAAVLAIALL